MLVFGKFSGLRAGFNVDACFFWWRFHDVGVLE